jgi:hypothetical protein
MNKLMTDSRKRRKKHSVVIYMRAVTYKKILLNEQTSSPVFPGNEKTQEKKRDVIRNEKLI